MPVSSPKHIIHYHFIISHVQFNSFVGPHNISCKKNNTKLHKVFWLSGSGLQGKRAITSALTHSRSRFAKLAISSATNENGSTLSWSSRNHIISRVCIQSVTISPWAGTSRATLGLVQYSHAWLTCILWANQKPPLSCQRVKLIWAIQI